MQTIDHTGKACPIPVIETKKVLEAAAPGTAVDVIVDNAAAVDNLATFAEQRGYGFERGETGAGVFHVTLTNSAVPAQDAPAAVATPADRRPVKVVAVGSATMGEGDDRLGATLLSGFLYALTEQAQWPDTIVFYNGGAHLTVEGSASLDDLRRLADGGVQILTCGTCLNHYGIADRLAVGGVTNMYAIAELLATADSVIKP